MADNVTIPATGSGTATPVIATDDVSGVQFQRVKLDAGGDGATTPILAGNGVAASALRVTLASDGTGTVAATQSGSWATTISGTVAISAAALPLPSGASTAAKQPALGTAGTASADVITVQGVASMVALKVDGSAVTQPVSGTVTIQDGGGSITVDGTVAATQSGTWTVTGAGGTFPVTDSGGSLTVDGTVAATQSGTWTVTGTGGTFPVTDSGGSLTVDNGGTFAVQAATAGDVANDAADSGNPVKIGAKATTGLTGATLVADGDRVDARADTDGAPVTRPYSPLPDVASGNASNTDGTSFSVIAAAGSGIRTYITTAIITNTSAAFAYVELKDGTTVMATIPVPATGGAVVTFPSPLRGTANTAWNCDPSAATTTIICSLSGFKSKV